MIGAECVTRASKGSVRAMSDRVIPKSLGSRAGLFGQILVSRGDLIVHPAEQHWDKTAEMRNYDFDIGISMRNLPDDHLKHHNGVFHRSADRAPQIEIIKQCRAESVHKRMEEKNSVAPVHFLVEWFEPRFGNL